MLFNAFQFWFFFAFVFIGYFFLSQKIKKNWFTQIFLLIVSVFFYACWNPFYVLLMFTSIVVTWISGNLMERYAQKKTLVLIGSLFINLAILFFFKYFNFFAHTSNRILGVIGSSIYIPNFNVLLPVGISFYTFQALGYSIDVYSGKTKHEKNFVTYALFVTFFPQLVAGPIERTNNLLPQFKVNYTFDYHRATSGLRLAAWGLFKKVIIADSLALYVNSAYYQARELPGLTLAIATVFFAVQIYCDFSGYSDIAIGVARVLGFDLMKNFKTPYFARSISEFWKRWHISLSTWLKDYVYIPLGGSRVSNIKIYRNLLITFVLSGFWHGASWHFVFWGLLHGLYQIIERATQKQRTFVLQKCRLIENGRVKKSWQYVQVIITFILVCLGWILFRADSMTDAFIILKKVLYAPYEIVQLCVQFLTGQLAFGQGFFGPYTLEFTYQRLFSFVVSIVILFIVDLFSYKIKTSIQNYIVSKPFVIRWSFYFTLVFICFYGLLLNIDAPKFIYFQF